MIPLKTWNSLSQNKRERAVKMIFNNMPDWYQANLAKEWHHNLDAEHRIILNSIYEKKDKNRTYYVVKVEQVL